MNHLGFVEPPHYIQNDSDLDYVSVTSKGEKGNFRNPQAGLVRHQFLEYLVRSAVRKYHDNQDGVVETRAEAVKIHLEKAKPFFEKFNLYENWRRDRYFNEECDVVLKHYNRVIK